MSGVAMTREAVAARLRAACAASSLGPRRGLPAKVGGEPSEVSARLRRAAELSDLCRRLGAMGRMGKVGGGDPRPGPAEVGADAADEADEADGVDEAEPPLRDPAALP